MERETTVESTHTTAPIGGNVAGTNSQREREGGGEESDVGEGGFEKEMKGR
ncbi:DUF659 domain-containing protein [Psidium guajava]|nr:DUF659 domain-containing protein [Psidium guajava]